MASRTPMELPFWLERETFQVEHCPNCPSAFKVRLVQYGRGTIDGTESDAIGFGKTLEEAANKALIQRDAVKALAIAKAAGVTVPRSSELGSIGNPGTYRHMIDCPASMRTPIGDAPCKCLCAHGFRRDMQTLCPMCHGGPAENGSEP